MRSISFQRNVVFNLPMLLVSFYANSFYTNQFFRLEATKLKAQTNFEKNRPGTKFDQMILVELQFDKV